MQIAFSSYDPDMLPGEFRYPAAYVKLSRSGGQLFLGPWWFIDANSKAGALAWSVRNHDGRNLIPFAKVDDGRGDVACFDGNDSSGNPAVLILVLDESGRSYSYSDFSAWLAAASAEVLR
ncbi:SMI1/KNR4 family protein [Acidovorax sp. LjRoot66]|uniref:SMI1/KNR4 family protein n=1 Tax=Acidovorax sp. LjRoot66 TaxID=3342334 RepID=UPI003ED1301E